MGLILYKKTKTGKIQQWQIEIAEDGKSFRTIEGFVGMKQTASEWTVCIAKNIGRANATSQEKQVVKEVNSRIKKQKDKGYVEDLKAAEEAVFGNNEPMAAFKYKDNIKEVEKWKMIAIQPKIDGARAVMRDRLYTRTNKPIVATPHILAELKEIREKAGINYVFDGEFYNHELKDDFNEIISIFKKQKPTVEDLEKSEKLGQYHIFDLDIPNVPFVSRYGILDRLLSQGGGCQYLQIVETIFLPQVNEEILMQYHERFVSQGYEGIMIRNANAMYEHNRTKNLLKYKNFIDEEFEVLGIEEGRGNKAGMAASILCKNNVNDEEFKAGLRGSEDFCRKLFEDRDKYIGKQATIRYQNLTPDRQVPRFSKFVAFRDYE